MQRRLLDKTYPLNAIGSFIVCCLFILKSVNTSIEVLLLNPQRPRDLRLEPLQWPTKESEINGATTYIFLKVGQLGALHFTALFCTGTGTGTGLHSPHTLHCFVCVIAFIYPFPILQKTFFTYMAGVCKSLSFVGTYLLDSMATFIVNRRKKEVETH